MKILTLTQPWASLVAIGAKRIETRSWGTGYRGDIAIHAAKGLGPVGGTMGLLELCASPPFAEVLARHHLDPGQLPRGAVVAVVRLARCAQMTPRTSETIERERPVEHAFGHYEAGRWLWHLGDLRPLLRPFPLRGQLGLRDIGGHQVEQIERLALEQTAAAA